MNAEPAGLAFHAVGKERVQEGPVKVMIMDLLYTHKPFVVYTKDRPYIGSSVKVGGGGGGGVTAHF